MSPFLVNDGALAAQFPQLIVSSVLSWPVNHTDADLPVDELLAMARLGVLDEHGYVIIKDRSKDIIISGGENISSVEVEDVLYKHPAVLFAAVVAKPDEKWGEVPCAFVELKDNASATEADIIAFCRGQMPGFKTPKAVVFGPIPKTSTGKIQKFMLRDQVK